MAYDEREQERKQKVARDYWRVAFYVYCVEQQKKLDQASLASLESMVQFIIDPKDKDNELQECDMLKTLSSEDRFEFAAKMANEEKRRSMSVALFKSADKDLTQPAPAQSKPPTMELKQ